MTSETGIRVALAATVTNRDGAAVGRLNEIVIERESRQVAGFHILTEELAPREVFVMVGQMARFEHDRLTLDLSDAEIIALPDARQHLFIAPQQDLDAELAAAESVSASATIPDPAERSTFSGIPGIALTPNLMIPMEVERAIMDDDQVAFRAGMRVLTATGEEIGQVAGIVVNDEARLIALDLQGHNERRISYDKIDTLDDDANEVILLAEGAPDVDVRA